MQGELVTESPVYWAFLVYGKMDFVKYKEIEVRKKPSFWRFIPWLSSYTAQAIISRIYVSEEIFKSLKLKNTNPKMIAVLEHEKKHIERQKELGPFKFGVKYLFSPKFRFQEELIAIRESMKYLKTKKLSFDIERSAGFLSSWLYLWMTSYDKAKSELEKIWDEV